MEAQVQKEVLRGQISAVNPPKSALRALFQKPSMSIAHLPLGGVNVAWISMDGLPGRVKGMR